MVLNNSMKNRFYQSIILITSVALFSCAAGMFTERSFNDIKGVYTISSSGKSNKEFIAALDIWGATSFGNWQKVKQVTNQERCILIFRYGDSYALTPLSNCTVLVSVQAKRKDEKNILVTFSNITHHLSTCHWINTIGVTELSANFQSIATQIENAIADF